MAKFVYSGAKLKKLPADSFTLIKIENITKMIMEDFVLKEEVLLIKEERKVKGSLEMKRTPGTCKT